MVGSPQMAGEPDLQDPMFLMYCYKVLPCPKKYRHDWRVCPFAHEGESAARRDPRKYKYVGVACPYAKQGKSCPRGDACPCTHNVFEYWLHPTRFRTEICSQGTKCNRSCCFFAHTESEMRKLKHQDIINSAVDDPAETCEALENYLEEHGFDSQNESSSTHGSEDVVITIDSMPNPDEEMAEEPLGMSGDLDRLPHSAGQPGMMFTPPDMVYCLDPANPLPQEQKTPTPFMLEGGTPPFAATSEYLLGSPAGVNFNALHSGSSAADSREAVRSADLYSPAFALDGAATGGQGSSELPYSAGVHSGVLRDQRMELLCLDEGLAGRGSCHSGVYRESPETVLLQDMYLANGQQVLVAMDAHGQPLSPASLAGRYTSQPMTGGFPAGGQYMQANHAAAAAAAAAVADPFGPHIHVSPTGSPINGLHEAYDARSNETPSPFGSQLGGLSSASVNLGAARGSVGLDQLSNPSPEAYGPVGGVSNLRSEYEKMSSSWGIGKNISSLSDSYAYSTPSVRQSLRELRGLGGVVGQTAGYDVPEDSVVNDAGLMNQGLDSGADFTFLGNLVSKNWTFESGAGLN